MATSYERQLLIESETKLSALAYRLSLGQDPNQAYNDLIKQAYEDLFERVKILRKELGLE